MIDALVAGGRVHPHLFIHCPGADADIATGLRTEILLSRLLLAAEVAALKAMARVARNQAWRTASLATGDTRLTQVFARHLRLVDEVTAAGGTDTAAPDVILTDDASLTGRLVARFPGAEVLVIETRPRSVGAAHRIGFREVLEGHDQTHFRILAFSADAPQGKLLFDGSNRTKLLYALNQAALWDRIGSVLLSHFDHYRPLRERSLESLGPAPRAAASTAGTDVSLLDVLTYPFNRAGSALRLMRDAQRGDRTWSVAVFELPAHARSSAAGIDARDLEHSVQFIEAPPGSFYADPFLWRDANDTLHCFVEDFVHAEGRARISVLRESAQGWECLGPVISEAFHLSFPFLFEYDGALFMCPETYEANEIRVYRCLSFPMQWTLEKVVMKQVSAADTMLFEHEGRWWMLTNRDRGAAPDHQAELHIYHAESPLSEQWTPLPGNPARVNSLGARNGGLLRDATGLYRCGQLQSMQAYGNGLEVFRITRLDPQGYDEESVYRLSPPDAWNATGTHTLGLCGNRGVVDLLGVREKT
ncbi:MAG: hypothetical protein R3E68_10060 [Burkholderiaceae bacterium]